MHKDVNKRREYQKRYKKAHPKTDKQREKARRAYLIKNFGITSFQFDELFLKQKGLCANCNLPETGKDNKGRIRRLAVDHDHNTGKVRWLLCHNCNIGLGNFKDSPILLRNMAKLLDDYNSLN